VIEVRVNGASTGKRGAGDRSVDVTFSIPARADMATVHLAGDFNDWSATDHPLRRDADVFTTTLVLQPGQRYRFKYLVNGERWENDWAADDYEPNFTGGDDSVLDLTRPRPPTT
jgi:1,4-alpha-glucan branching enzyme